MNVRKPNNHVTPINGNNIAERRNQALTCLARVIFSLDLEALLIRCSMTKNKIELI